MYSKEFWNIPLALTLWEEEYWKFDKTFVIK
jgi:hypothetical protein